MPYRLCMAMAPGAIWLMNACWEAVPGTCVASADGTFLVYDGPDGAGELWCAPAAGAPRPRVTAPPAPPDAPEPPPARGTPPAPGPRPALAPPRVCGPPPARGPRPAPRPRPAPGPSP